MPSPNNMKADITILRRMNDLINPASGTDARIAALTDPDWQIIQAACNGLSVTPDAAAIEPLAAVLADQDGRDLYAIDEWSVEPVEKPEELDYRNRFRVKQAALGALKAIAARHPLPQSLVDKLCTYATDALEDYPVRAAAADVLAHVPGAQAEAALQETAKDTEWCTATTARRALAGRQA